MSRDDGFAVADIDSAYLDDAKMRDLWQLLRDPDQMARAVVLHQATMLASWRHGERLTVQQAAPIWLPCDDALIGALKTVRLLDKACKVSSESWRHWFGVAAERREKRRASGQKGGIRSGITRSNASATLEPRSSPTEPVRPSVPSVPTVRPSGGARAGAEDIEADPADAYWQLAGRYPTGKPLAWLDDLTREFGPVPVIRAMAMAHQSDGTVSTLLGRAQDILRREARTLDLKGQAEQRKRIAERRSTPRRAAGETDEESAERNRIIRELMGGRDFGGAVS